MMRLLTIFGSFSLPFVLTISLLLKWFQFDDPNLISIIASIGIIGFLTYIIITIVAYNDCDKKDFSDEEREFWKKALIKCFYYFSGTPVYYSVNIEGQKGDHLNKSLRSVEKIKGDIVYNIFRFEIYAFLIALSLSAVIAGISVLVAKPTDVPILLFNLAVLLILPFPIISHVFYLRMLYEFVQESRSIDELNYYFGQKRWMFGVVKYYKNSRKKINVEIVEG